MCSMNIIIIVIIKCLDSNNQSDCVYVCMCVKTNYAIYLYSTSSSICNEGSTLQCIFITYVLLITYVHVLDYHVHAFLRNCKDISSKKNS